MIAEIERLFIPNSALNYNHLVVCTDSRKTAVIDPFDADFVFNHAEQQNLPIEQIWITHEHPDHTRGLERLKQLTQATVYAPISCKGKLEADVWLSDQQSIELGQCTVEHLLTPGHTPGHGIFWQPEHWAVCGDTLFNAGVGNTKSGDVSELYRTILRLKSLFTDTVTIYTGHDYLITNLKFSLSLNPDLELAKQLLAQASEQSPQTRTITTWAIEKQINLFLQAANEAEFTKLRAKRDHW